jgi:glutamine synthetase type III
MEHGVVSVLVLLGTSPSRELRLGRVDQVFGSDVFSERVMQQRLPKDVFKRLQRTIQHADPSTTIRPTSLPRR